MKLMKGKLTPLCKQYILLILSGLIVSFISSYVTGWLFQNGYLK